MLSSICRVFLLSLAAAAAWVSKDTAPNVGDAALTAFAVEDYKRALEWAEPAAQQGDAVAQLVLGRMYAKGAGVEMDKAQAAAWFTMAELSARPAAEKGDARAQFVLGSLYGSGDGVTQDARESVAWYRKAAAQGICDAQNALGVMSSYGLGTGRDYGEAAAWFRRAAEAGHVEAQANLARSYELGLGVTQDAAEARRWYGKAADRGHRPAAKRLEVLSPHHRTSWSYLDKLLGFLRPVQARDLGTQERLYASFMIALTIVIVVLALWARRSWAVRGGKRESEGGG